MTTATYAAQALYRWRLKLFVSLYSTARSAIPILAASRLPDRDARSLPVMDRLTDWIGIHLKSMRPGEVSIPWHAADHAHNARYMGQAKGRSTRSRKHCAVGAYARRL